MKTTADFKDGDEVFLCWVHVEHQGSGKIEPRVRILKATIFMAQHNLVRAGNEAPRQPWVFEEIFATEADAYRYASARLSETVGTLQAEAARLSEQADVADKQEVA